MLQQILHNEITRQDANGEQPSFFGQPTTDFFGMQILPIDREVTPAPQMPRERRTFPRREVIESLERSLAEHGDIWAELANH